MRARFFIIAGLAATLMSCHKDDATKPPEEYQLTVGDTTITIPDSAVTFAKAQFSVEAYFLREYQVAHSHSYTGTLIDWKALAWSVRSTFLVDPYVRDVRIADNAHYYYEIGTFLDQFGYGWKDTFAADANLNDPASDIWLYPSDATNLPDNPGTIGFDGGAHFMAHFRSMWRIQ